MAYVRFNLDTYISSTLFNLRMMKKEVKLNTIVWILLIVLICASTLLAENSFNSAFLIISGLSVVKFLSVIFQFVEVKHAHLAWKITSVIFVIVFFFGILILY